jgi:hypothetical protein
VTPEGWSLVIGAIGAVVIGVVRELRLVRDVREMRLNDEARLEQAARRDRRNRRDSSQPPSVPPVRPSQPVPDFVEEETTDIHEIRRELDRTRSTVRPPARGKHHDKER